MLLYSHICCYILTIILLFFASCIYFCFLIITIIVLLVNNLPFSSLIFSYTGNFMKFHVILYLACRQTNKFCNLGCYNVRCDKGIRESKVLSVLILHFLSQNQEKLQRVLLDNFSQVLCQSAN